MNNCKLTSAWKVLKFEECITQLNTGLNPRNNFKLGTGKLKYITAKNLTKYGTIDFSKCEYIDEVAKQIINKRSDIKIGDVLLSSRAPIGQCHLIKENPDFYDIGESIFSIRANKSIILPEYLCLYLSSDFFVKVASKNTTGSIIKEIRIGDLMKINVVVPPMSIQKKIADCLNALDGKIANNNAISAKLESLAKTIYDYWFLQFEFPNKEGKPYKSSGGKMVWNEELKREIPEGWTYQNINSLIQCDKGGDWGQDTCIGNYQENVNCIRGADFPAALGKKALAVPERWILTKNKSKELMCGDILIEISGGSPTQSTGRICYINNHFLERFTKPVVTSNFCKAISLKQPRYYSWFYIMWQKLYDNGLFFNYEGKTTGLKNLLFDDVINSVKIIIPNESVLDDFTKLVNYMFETIQLNGLKTQQLTSLRDFLLPLLMNGQVTFKDEAAPEEE